MSNDYILFSVSYASEIFKKMSIHIYRLIVIYLKERERQLEKALHANSVSIPSSFSTFQLCHIY